MNNSEGRGLALLATLQLADSFFPTGAYAHSQGLEGMVALGWVSNSAEVKEYLTELLTGAVLPSDGVALLNAHGAAANGDIATVIDIDRLLHAMKLPEEMRLASTQSGRRFLDESRSLLATATSVVEEPARSDFGATRSSRERGNFDPQSSGFLPTQERRSIESDSITFPLDQGVFEEYWSAVVRRDSPGSAAVAFAVSAWAGGVEADAALYAFCHSFAVGVLGAAQRLLPLTHGEAQHILRSLHDHIAAGAEDIEGRHWRDMTSFTPQADIASMCHQHAEVRMFAS